MDDWRRWKKHRGEGPGRRRVKSINEVSIQRMTIIVSPCAESYRVQMAEMEKCSQICG